MLRAWKSVGKNWMKCLNGPKTLSKTWNRKDKNSLPMTQRNRLRWDYEMVAGRNARLMLFDHSCKTAGVSYMHKRKERSHPL